ncbi:hypothetical protein M9H77_26462 [Catharanthus roseus]|uniref:Uncharacterized protein n=1 Tax=Catharanthus roseus TaxID=4058 RepID=A0ACC0AA42_CATRO|nr:hypothetical protein M9H77_26462 [Catharanthus roseus]
MALHDSELLQHANGVYTIKAYMLFERQFMRFPEFCQGLVVSNDCEHVFEIWRPDISRFKRTIVYNEHTLSISCTYKMFSEVGILCSHCLRIQAIIRTVGVCDAEKVNKKDIASSSVWRTEMFRKFSYLISAIELNPYSNIRDLIGSCTRGERNVRKKSIIEIRCNQAKGKRKNALMCALRNKTMVQLSITNNEALGKAMDAPSSECQFSLGISSYNDVEQSSTLQAFINFM